MDFQSGLRSCWGLNDSCKCNPSIMFARIGFLCVLGVVG